MKSICFIILLFFSVAIFATEGNKSTIPITNNSISPEHIVNNAIHQYLYKSSEVDLRCTITATGTINAEALGTFKATISVSGPCNASLAQKMRDAIAALRAAFK